MALEHIAASVNEISEHVSAIAVSAQEQSSGLGEINAAMGQLDQLTQHNATMFEETTAAAQNLSSSSEELESAVYKFRFSTQAAEVRPVPKALWTACNLRCAALSRAIAPMVGSLRMSA